MKRSLERPKQFHQFRRTIHDLPEQFDFVVKDVLIENAPLSYFHGCPHYDQYDWICNDVDKQPASQQQLNDKCYALSHPSLNLSANINHPSQQQYQQQQQYQDVHTPALPDSKRKFNGQTYSSFQKNNDPYVTQFRVFGDTLEGDSICLTISDMQHFMVVTFKEYMDQRTCWTYLNDARNAAQDPTVTFEYHPLAHAIGFLPDRKRVKQPRKYNTWIIRSYSKSPFYKMRSFLESNPYSGAEFLEHAQLKDKVRFYMATGIRPQHLCTVSNWKECTSFVSHAQIELLVQCHDLKCGDPASIPSMVMSFDIECETKDLAPGEKLIISASHFKKLQQQQLQQIQRPPNVVKKTGCTNNKKSKKIVPIKNQPKLSFMKLEKSNNNNNTDQQQYQQQQQSSNTLSSFNAHHYDALAAQSQAEASDGKFYMVNCTLYRNNIELYPELRNNWIHHLIDKSEYKIHAPPERYTKINIEELNHPEEESSTVGNLPTETYHNFQFLVDPLLEQASLKFTLPMPYANDKSTGIHVAAYRTELDCLTAFRDFMVLAQPDIYMGHNTLNYDWPKLYQRIEILTSSCGSPQRVPRVIRGSAATTEGNPSSNADESSSSSFVQWHTIQPNHPWYYMGMMISRISYLNEKHGYSKGKGETSQYYPNMYASMDLDTMLGVREYYTERLESYESLKALSEEILDDAKVDLDVFTMDRLYKNGLYKEMCQYCWYDCILPIGLASTVGLIGTYEALASTLMTCTNEMVKKGLQFQIFQVFAIESWVRGHMVNNMHFPAPASYDGGTVFKPKPGIHKENPTVVGDFEGLYPAQMNDHNPCLSTLILPFNEKLDLISRDTTADGLKLGWDQCIPVLKKLYGDVVIPDAIKNDPIRIDQFHRVMRHSSAYTTQVHDDPAAPKIQFVHFDAKKAETMKEDDDDYPFEGIIPGLERKWRTKRRAIKKQMADTQKLPGVYDGVTWFCRKSNLIYNEYNSRQLAFKLAMNSTYGILGAKLETDKEAATSDNDNELSNSTQVQQSYQPAAKNEHNDRFLQCVWVALSITSFSRNSTLFASELVHQVLNRDYTMINTTVMAEKMRMDPAWKWFKDPLIGPDEPKKVQCYLDWIQAKRGHLDHVENPAELTLNDVEPALSLVYGDTDSIMLLLLFLKLKMGDEFDPKVMAEAMVFGFEITAYVTAVFKLFGCVYTNLQFEKIYYPFLLFLVKKAYAGMKYEKNPNKPEKLDCKTIGIQRSLYPFIRNMTKELFNMLLIKDQPEQCVPYIEDRFLGFLDSMDQLNLDDFCKSQQLRKSKYDVWNNKTQRYNNIPAYVLANQKFAKEFPGQERQLGQRVFTFLKFNPQAKKRDNVASITMVKEHYHSKKAAGSTNLPVLNLPEYIEAARNTLEKILSICPFYRESMFDELKEVSFRKIMRIIKPKNSVLGYFQQQSSSLPSLKQISQSSLEQIDEPMQAEDASMMDISE